MKGEILCDRGLPELFGRDGCLAVYKEVIGATGIENRTGPVWSTVRADAGCESQCICRGVHTCQRIRGHLIHGRFVTGEHMRRGRRDIHGNQHTENAPSQKGEGQAPEQSGDDNDHRRAHKSEIARQPNRMQFQTADPCIDCLKEREHDAGDQNNRGRKDPAVA